MKQDILIVGVGGQGSLLASVLLGNLGMHAGYDVKLSEVHGMAQRGGSVVTHVRYATDEVDSPTINEGCADVIIAFEQMEAFRWISYLKKGGKLFVNTQKISSMPIIMGVQKYPVNIFGFFEENQIDAVSVDAEKMAIELGNPRVVNIIMLGAAAKVLPFSKEDWFAELENTIKQQFIDINKKAFELGYQL